MWNLTAIQGFPGSFPDFPGSSPDFPRSFPDFPGGQPCRGREAPGTPFQTLFGGFLGRGLFDPCRRPTMSQGLPHLLGPPPPRVRKCERTLFGALWKMSRIFREISCDHVSWKSKDENLQNVSPIFHRIFRPPLVKNSPELRSGRLRA